MERERERDRQRERGRESKRKNKRERESKSKIERERRRNWVILSLLWSTLVVFQFVLLTFLKYYVGVSCPL